MMNLGMEHGIAVLHVSGLLAKSDYAEVLPQLEHQIESQDKPRVMVVPAASKTEEVPTMMKSSRANSARATSSSASTA